MATMSKTFRLKSLNTFNLLETSRAPPMAPKSFEGSLSILKSVVIKASGCMVFANGHFKFLIGWE